MTQKPAAEIIAELEKRAWELLELKRDALARRPIVIEFCGAPKSGKSSCINSLELFLRRNKFRTRVLTERASVCPIRNKFDPLFNIWTVSSAIAELAEILSNSPKDYDVVFLDRGIFDALCWFNWQREHHHLDENTFRVLESFLTMNKWRAALDLILVFTATPEVSLQREYAHLLTRKTGSIMRPDVLSSYQRTIMDAADIYSDKFQKIEVFDTSDIKQNDVSYEVTKRTLEILQENKSEKIGFVRRAEITTDVEEKFSYSEAFSPTTPLHFDVRAKVESDSKLIQPIPILVITNPDRNRVFVVKKNKKVLSKTSPEDDKLLLYLGGHIRREDSYHSNDSNLLSIAQYALHREIKEEVGLDYFPPQNELICIWTRDNERSRKHLALCYVFEADIDSLKLRLDSNEFMTTGNTISGSIFTMDQVLKRKRDLEPWSKIILREIFGVSLGEQMSIFPE